MSKSSADHIPDTVTITEVWDIRDPLCPFVLIRFDDWPWSDGGQCQCGIYAGRRRLLDTLMPWWADRQLASGRLS